MCIPSDKMWHITICLEAEKTKIDILKRYSKKMPSEDLKRLLLEISSEKIK